jgi:hypothetical protein
MIPVSKIDKPNNSKNIYNVYCQLIVQLQTFNISNKCTISYTLCVLLLVCSNILPYNRHLQRAYTDLFINCNKTLSHLVYFNNSGVSSLKMAITPKHVPEI